jgi:hypothetical protein
MQSTIAILSTFVRIYIVVLATGSPPNKAGIVIALWKYLKAKIQ